MLTLSRIATLGVAMISGIVLPAAAEAAYTLATPNCTLNSNSWCVSGASMTNFKTAITNTSNFGTGGTVGTAITLSELGVVNATTLAGANGFISTYWSDTQSNSSVTAIVNFFLGGGDLILMQDNSSYDAIGAALGLAAVAAAGTASNGTSPLFQGPFGSATNVTQTGAYSYLTTASITAKNGTIGGVNTSGQATSAYWAAGQYAAGAGRLVILGDVDNVSNSSGNHYTPATDNNGRFSLNSIAYLVGAGAVPEPASWMMMVGGFGLIGAAMRRQRGVAVRFA